MTGMDYEARSIALHKKKRGKIALAPTFPARTRKDLSVAYTPGVAGVSKLLHSNPDAAYTHSIKGNTVAVVSDGSAVLGLGNIGPLGALPVMEGKALLFKKFGGVDAFPIVLATQDVEEIIATVKNIAPTFGGINLEDISAPRCFEIEARLKAELNIPVFHDDQHGTAIVVLAGLINALKVVKKNRHEARIVMNGAGAAAQAIFHLLIQAGFDASRVIMLDTKGILEKNRIGLDQYKQHIADISNIEGRSGGLNVALVGADVFIGVSIGNVLTPELVGLMSSDSIVFAMANPTPEISYDDAQRANIAVFGTGRSDYPNQINNVLVFPGLFRGVLDARVNEITDAMKIAAGEAIARLVPDNKLSAHNIIPKPFNKRVAKAVAHAVMQAAGK